MIGQSNISNNMVILVTGANGMLGTAICDVLAETHTVIGLGHGDFDVTDSSAWSSISSFQTKPDLIVHCAAFTQVDAAENEPSKALWETNVNSIQRLCDACLSLDIGVVYPQSFLVLRDQPEAHPPNSKEIQPLGWYSKSKWEAEEILMQRLPPGKRMIIRLGGFFGGGPDIDKNFVGLFLKRILPQALHKGDTEISIGDRIWQPTWTKDIANILCWCLEEPWRESYQYAAQDFASFADLAQAILDILSIKDVKISKVSSDKIPVAAPRPQQIIMRSSDELIQSNLVYPYQLRLKEYLSTYWSGYNPMDYLIANNL
jgi:dTDP-4-dehydrorhamnose reductase